MTQQLEFCFEELAPGSLDKEAARRERQREAQLRYELSPKGAARRKAYNALPASKAAQKRWTESARGKTLRQIRRARMRVQRCLMGLPRHIFSSVAAWKRFQYATDKDYAIACRLRGRVYGVLKARRARKSESTEKLLGCSVPEFRTYLERHFLPGMNWDNRALWEIDHDIPCWAFDLRREDEQRRCFHHTNQRPLWKSTNRRKKHKMREPRQLPLL